MIRPSRNDGFVARLSHCLTDGEEHRLFAVVSGKNRLALEFALLPGVSRNTQASIRWRDVDFQQSEIWIEDAKKSRKRLLRVPFDLLVRLRTEGNQPSATWTWQ
jgi:hypothetical protein